MSPIEEKPSRNEEEYFARENAERIKALRARLDAERAASERSSHHMRCPRCGGQMSERGFHNILVDVCADCGGTFFDKGELEMLEHVEPSRVRDFVGGLFGLKR